MRVVTSKQMKQIEEASLAHDLTFHRLMENAGSAAAAFIRRTFNVQGLNCLIFCGSGNNGGDGFVVARKLFENEANVLVVLVGPLPNSDEATTMYSTAELMEIPIADFDRNRDKVLGIMAQADIVVDAIYGTGFHGRLDEPARAACAAINAAISAVVALDIPSGVECDSGVCDPDAVRADFTVTFDSHKPCHMLPASLPCCGKVEVVDIGIPDAAREGIVSSFGTLTTESVLAHLPPRDTNAHKGDFGKLLSVCGSARYRGAAVMSTLGALRSGVAILTLAAPEIVCSTVAGRIAEATFLPLADAEDDTAIPPALDAAITSATAILFGCGMEKTPRTSRLLKYIVKHATCPLIVDADGINVLAENINILQEAKAPVILTPHPGEMARLCSMTVAQVEADRNTAVTGLAQSLNAVVVLKGHRTVVAGPDGSLMVNATGNPGLAKGGSGDVLAGMMAAFAAQGLAPVHAAGCAVHLHGLAADRTAARLSQYAMLPSELLDDLAAIFAENGR